jgi:hypothetical protein
VTGRKVGGKKPSKKLRSRFVNNVNVDVIELEFDGVDWIGLTQNRDQLRALVNAVLRFRVS